MHSTRCTEPTHLASTMVTPVEDTTWSAHRAKGLAAHRVQQGEAATSLMWRGLTHGLRVRFH